MEYATLPPTPKQVDFAKAIATKLRSRVPSESANDRRALSDWISVNHQRLKARSKQDSGRGSAATSKQVALAERLAKRKRIDVPAECFRDAKLMSGWIGRHL